MKLSRKARLIKSLAIVSLAAVVALAAPHTAEAQGFGVAVRFGNSYPAAYGPAFGDHVYPDRFRAEEWRRHEEWVRHEEWLRHRQWERDRFFGHPAYAPFPGYFGR